MHLIQYMSKNKCNCNFSSTCPNLTGSKYIDRNKKNSLNIMIVNSQRKYLITSLLHAVREDTNAPQVVWRIMISGFRLEKNIQRLYVFLCSNFDPLMRHHFQTFLIYYHTNDKWYGPILYSETMMNIVAPSHTPGSLFQQTWICTTFGCLQWSVLQFPQRVEPTRTSGHTRVGIWYLGGLSTPCWPVTFTERPIYWWDKRSAP